VSDNVCVRLFADSKQIDRCKVRIELKADYFNELSRVLALAGNEVRLKILYLLFHEKELCVCDLSDILGMTISAISQHLRKLKDGHLVDVRKDGQTYYYFIKEKHRTLLQTIIDA